MFDNAMLRAFIEKSIQAEFCSTASIFSEIKEATYRECVFNFTPLRIKHPFHFTIRVYFTYTTGYSTVKGNKQIFGISGIFEKMGNEMGSIASLKQLKTQT